MPGNQHTQGQEGQKDMLQITQAVPVATVALTSVIADYKQYKDDKYGSSANVGTGTKRNGTGSIYQQALMYK